MSVDYNLNLHCSSKIAEAKYFFLFREAKHRKIVINVPLSPVARHVSPVSLSRRSLRHPLQSIAGTG
ncbi:YaaL family protein [Bacillus enclensis]|uniref:YaaL family protein n=1 Tax=[Bacillus] enclensis TaxID=1402860 RepID=UPI0018DE6E15|nr:YaaL family protein [[Bacillus] enclensis]